VERLATLREAVAIEQRELQRLHKVDIAAAAVDHLVQDYEAKNSVSIEDDMYDADNEDGYWSNTYYDVANSGGTGGANAALKFAWNALAEASSSDLPFVPAMSISRRSATSSRKAVKDAGGTAKVADQWLDGENNEATDSLFYPFGNITEEEKLEVANRLTSNPSQSDTLWLSAVSFAERK
jgi:hypothetical protein